MENSGVYIIYCIGNNHAYVGSSFDVKKRLIQHSLLLSIGKHPNRHMQESYNELGCGSFLTIILSSGLNKEQRLIEERKTIASFGNLTFNTHFKYKHILPEKYLSPSTEFSFTSTIGRIF